MKGSDIVLIGLTFITGMFAGAYLYVTVYVPSYGVTDSVGVSETRFEVAGEIVGACGTEVCPSFMVKQDRSYVYVPGYAFSERSPETTSGKLSGLLLRELEAIARDTEMATVTGRCEPGAGSIGYRYRVVLDGTAYTLSTCDTRFAETALADRLDALWDEVVVVQNAPAAVLEEGAIGGLERYLRSQFRWNEE